jgi:hypothetical protein
MHIAEGNAGRTVLESSTGKRITFGIVVKTAKGAIFQRDSSVMFR